MGSDPLHGTELFVVCLTDHQEDCMRKNAFLFMLVVFVFKE